MSELVEGIKLALAFCEAVERLMAAKFVGDIYRQAAADVLNISPDEVTPEQRLAVKNASFGIRYRANTKTLFRRDQFTTSERVEPVKLTILKQKRCN